MNILLASEWFPNWETHPTWTQVVDLRQCDDCIQVMRACAKVLHGEQSTMGGMRNEPNLNWLNEVVRDWFIENWGEKSILIAGGGHLVQIDTTFALTFLDTVNSAFVDAIHDRAQRFGGEGIADEIIRTDITLVMN